MAVTAQMTLISNCDSVTGWSAGGVSADLLVREGTAALGSKISGAVFTADYTGTPLPVDLSDGRHVYVWMATTTPGLMGTQANGGLGIRITAASTTKTWYVSGSDTYPANGGWVRFVVDPFSTPSDGTGAFTSGNLSSVTGIGVRCNMTQMIGGGTNNFFWDVIHVGTGYQVTGGTSGSPVLFSDLLTTDNTGSYGVVRSSGGVYFLSGKVLIGDGSTSTFFKAESQVVSFEDRSVSSTFYEKSIDTSATLQLGNRVSGVTSDGCTIFGSGTSEFSFNTSGGTTLLYASVLAQAQAVSLATGDEVYDCTFRACGLITPGGATISNTVVTGSTDTVAMTVASPTQMSTITDCSFTNNDRAIEITTAGTYSFDNISFSGNTFDVRNNSGGAVTINVLGGNSPSVENIGGSTTTVNNSVSLTLNGIVNGSEVLILRDSDSAVLFTDESVTGNSTSYAYNAGADTPVTVFVHHVNYVPVQLALTLGSANQTIPVQQRTDRVYKNP